MHRFLFSQLRFRRGRVAALGLGILVAAVSFTLLTAAADTSELRVKGTVAKNFRTAYDILVRPEDSFTTIEKERGFVRNNYLGGIFGGISFDQYREIKRIRGVEVAAPIANVGYILPVGRVAVRINEFFSEEAAQLYRLRFTWLANSDTSIYPDSDQYVYYTRANPMAKTRRYGAPEEIVDGGRVPVCSGFYGSHPDPSGPFALPAFTELTCFSEKSPKLKAFLNPTFERPSVGWVGTYSQAYFPVLLAAIDPVEEQRLVGLDETLVSGRMLREREGTRLSRRTSQVSWRVVPVLASTRTYVDEVLRVEIERLDVPEPSLLRKRLASKRTAYQFVTGLEGIVVSRRRVDIDGIYGDLVKQITAPEVEIPYEAYWTTSSVDYRVLGNDTLAPRIVKNPPSVFESSAGGGWAPQENRDVQFRKLTQSRGSDAFVNNGRELATPALQVIGRFDPERLPGFSKLASVPLETYYPPLVEPADRATTRALGGKPLLPVQNLGDYISQPPLMLTTLKALRVLTDPERFTNAEPEAPIGVIRVRVANVTGPDAESGERIRRVAQAIHDRTGLAIDITAGSSPHPLRVELPAGKFGRPPLVVEEGWTEKGVAVAFLEAVDRKSLALFGLILVICIFFLANGVLAAVRTRRTEIGTLLCLGWSRTKIFSAILGEVTLVGTIAGLLGTGLAASLVAGFSLEMSFARALLVMPVAVGLAVISALVPAWRASASTPLDAVRPAVSQARRSMRTRHIVSMATANLRRVPGRTALGAAGLFIGVGALTILVAINHGLQGVLVGTVMGQFISLEIRGVDLLTVAFTIALGGFAVADVLYLNVKERAAEFVTLRTVGWRDRDMVKLVATEGIAMGGLGSAGGAVVGAATALLVQDVPVVSIAVAVSIAAASGIFAAALASLVPLFQIGRLTPSSVLAEEW